MKFSVLVPIYNTEKYLDECVQSILNQIYQDFEIILVDDGSTDSSPQICDRYQRYYPDKIKVIHKDNQGLISARRIGIANADSDYCIFVDSDDYINPELLSVLYSQFSKDKSIDLLIYSFEYISEGESYKTFPRIAEDGKVWVGEEKKELYEKLIFTDDVTSIWTKAVRTSLVKSDPTDYSVYQHKNMAEDRLQSLYLLTYADRIKYTFQPLYCYRYNAESISRSFSISSIQKRNMIHVYDKILEYLPLWNMDTEEHHKRLNAKWFDETMYAFCKAFEFSQSARERKALLAFDWNSMLASTDVDSYSKYAGQSYLKIYHWYSEKKCIRLQLYFIKRKLYKKYKSLKKK